MSWHTARVPETPDRPDPARPRTAVWLFSDAPAAGTVEGIVLADRRGIDEVWVADEGVPREPVPVLSFAAAWTGRVRLGVGITSPFLRHPGSIGSTIATLDELSGGRVMLGLGVGGNLSLDPFGLSVTRPIGAMRDAVRIARGVISRQACEGYDPPAHAGPGRNVPIFIGARGEQMNRLASEVADGVFLSGFDLSQLDRPVDVARSLRPIHIGLFASVHFRPPAQPDATALSGSAAEIADCLQALIERYRPGTIGLALVDGDAPAAMVGLAADVFDRVGLTG